MLRIINPEKPFKNFYKWLSYIRQTATNIPLQDNEIERPFTINADHLAKVIQAKALRN